MGFTVVETKNRTDRQGELFLTSRKEHNFLDGLCDGMWWTWGQGTNPSSRSVVDVFTEESHVIGSTSDWGSCKATAASCEAVFFFEKRRSESLYINILRR
jgi:hypothetical protein